MTFHTGSWMEEFSQLKQFLFPDNSSQTQDDKANKNKTVREEESFPLEMNSHIQYQVESPGYKYICETMLIGLSRLYICMYVTMIIKDEEVMNLGRGGTWKELDREERRVMYGVDKMFMFDILKKSKNCSIQQCKSICNYMSALQFIFLNLATIIPVHSSKLEIYSGTMEGNVFLILTFLFILKKKVSVNSSSELLSLQDQICFICLFLNQQLPR